MGQLRFAVYAHWQIGLMIKIDEYTLDINLPFIAINIALTKYAKGVEIFGMYLS